MRTPRPRTLLVVAAVAVVVVLAVVLGPILYARSQDAAPAPLSVDDLATSPSAPESVDPPTPGSETAGTGTSDPQNPGTGDLDGRWTVSDGSQAGYRVDEVLNGEDVTVVGRTDDVTGTAEVADGALTSAVVEVDVATVATDSDRRDSYFTGTAMRVSEHPTATFRLTEPVSVPALGEEPVEVQARGELELVGVSREVVADIQVVRDGEAVAASGSVDVTFANWGIDAPDLGFVQVEESGQVEFLVRLTR